MVAVRNWGFVLVLGATILMTSHIVSFAYAKVGFRKDVNPFSLTECEANNTIKKFQEVSKINDVLEQKYCVAGICFRYKTCELITHKPLRVFCEIMFEFVIVFGAFLLLFYVFIQIMLSSLTYVYHRYFMGSRLLCTGSGCRIQRKRSSKNRHGRRHIHR